MFLHSGKAVSRTAVPAQKIVAGLERLFERHENLDGLLQAAARVLVESLPAQRCVITWLAEDNVTMWVRATHSRRSFYELDHTNGLAMLAEEVNGNVVHAVAFSTHEGKKNGAASHAKLSMPLRVNRHLVGYLCVSNGGSASGRGAHLDLELLHAMSEILGHAIEHLQMRQMLASRYLAAAAGRARGGENAGPNTPESRVLQSVQNPEKVARILARSFYKDLRKAGFAAKHILLIASEIIGHLGETFHKTKAQAK